jgi:hypothetical protein
MNIQSSGGMKNSTICATNVRRRRMKKKIIDVGETNEVGVAEMTNDE